ASSRPWIIPAILALRGYAGIESLPSSRVRTIREHWGAAGREMKIRKVYFSLDEIRERWRLCERDLAYLAENGEVNVSVRVFSLPIEICSMEEDFDGTWFSVPHTRTRFSGLLDLHA